MMHKFEPQDVIQVVPTLETPCDAFIGEFVGYSDDDSGNTVVLIMANGVQHGVPPEWCAYFGRVSKVWIIESELGYGQKVVEAKTFNSRLLADQFVKQFNSENCEDSVPDWYMYAEVVE